ncbi:TPA: M48 family peptidase, partial [Campylobacter lari]|nr:M48 family peptidase [Campylobacter lari]
MTLITILCIYTAFLIFISYMQISFLKKEREKQAIILNEQDYKNTANIAIENEKYKIFS